MTRLLILGAGVSGKAAARLASREGMPFTMYDEVPNTEMFSMGVSLASGPWDPILLHGVDLIVASPGFSERSAPILDAFEAGLPIWSEIEFAARHIDVPLAAVTGTNGKTTVTEAAAAMLEASGLNAPATGNIGSPLSEHTEDRYDAIVAEVSSFQLRFIDSFHPKAAAITNVASDHLDWHGSVQSYMRAKARIYENQTSGDLLVYDGDDEGAVGLVSGARSELVPVSGIGLSRSGYGVRGDELVLGGPVVGFDELPSADRTHLVNLACAAALATRMGASDHGVVSGAKTYTPGAHRRSLVFEAEGVKWVDDSKATNPHAAIASVRSNESVVLIAGGLDKGLDVSPLALEPNVRVLIGIGESGPALVEAAGERGALAETLDAAVAMARRVAKPGDTVLLAPGCASFDQFESYSERGDRFTELVRGTAA